MSGNEPFIPKDEVAFLGNWTFLRDVLDHVNPKFDVEFNGDGPGGRLGFLITNLLTSNVSGAVNSGSCTVLGECSTRSTQNLT